MKRFFLTIVIVLFLVPFALADVRLPKTFSNNAVLQRDRPVQIWGWADPQEKISVEFNDQKVETTANEKGCWTIKLAPMTTLNQGKELVIRGKNSIKLSNIVVGDVWVCSGQSNMFWTMTSGNDAKGNFRISALPEELEGDYSFIRYFRDPRSATQEPQDDLKTGQWNVCRGKAIGECTAVGFYFALRMNQELGIPVGLIDCNYGASRIESWMPKDAFAKLSDQERNEIEKIMAKPRYNNIHFNILSGMFNSKLNPWTKYAIRGALWYQGESNGMEGDFYFVKKKRMIESWRKHWGYDFPFYWVQLANYTKAIDDPNKGLGWTAIRDAQTKCLTIPQTGQAVTIDLGEANDIHPRNKFDVGNRLAIWSLAQDFGKKIVYASPLFKEVKVEKNKVIVTFDCVGSGLVVGHQVPRHFSIVKNGELKRFALAGNNGIYYWAKAKIIDKDKVEITCDEVNAPKAVRYAWQKNPEGCNLYNAEGLPATPFCVEIQ